MKYYTIGNKIGLYTIYVLLLVFFLFPVLYVFALSLKTSAEILEPTTLFNFLPRHPTFENFGKVMVNIRMSSYLLNSGQLVLSTVVGVLLISIPAAYALSRGKFRYKNGISVIILFFQMISPLIISIPIYWYYSRLGLLNNFWGIAFIYIAIHLPFSVFLLKGVFDAIPYDLDEAARIDGCSNFKTLALIITPSALPGLTTTITFTSVNAWAQFIIPYFLIDSDRKMPISVGILQAQGSYQDISTHYLAAASVIALVPSVILVMVLQRFIVRALVQGAVKG